MQIPPLIRVAARLAFAAGFAAHQPSAQTSPVSPPGASASAPAAVKPFIPIAASTLAGSGNRLMGEPVSLTGAVDAIVSKQAFTVDQDRTKSDGPAVLVLAAGLSSDVRANRAVTVLGDVVTLTPEVVVAQLKDRAGEIPADVVARFAGKPAVVAKTVLQDGVDLTRRLPPPLSSEEAAFAEVMKRIGPAFGQLRQSIENTPPTVARPTTATLKKGFADAEEFWKARATKDAASWAADGRKQVELLNRAAADGRWDAVKTATGALGKTCQACHGVHRERFDDGSYRIKGPAR